MSNAVHVYKTSKGWAVRKPGALRVIAYYRYRSDAIARGRAYLIKRGGGNLRVHKRGRIDRTEEVTDR